MIRPIVHLNPTFPMESDLLDHIVNEKDDDRYSVEGRSSFNMTIIKSSMLLTGSKLMSLQTADEIKASKKKLLEKGAAARRKAIKEMQSKQEQFTNTNESDADNNKFDDSALKDALVEEENEVDEEGNAGLGLNLDDSTYSQPFHVLSDTEFDDLLHGDTVEMNLLYKLPDTPIVPTQLGEPMLSSLPEREEEWVNREPSHTNVNWEEKFEKMRRNALSGYKYYQNPEVRKIKSNKSNFTQFMYLMVPDVRSPLIYANNLCFKPSVKTFYFYMQKKQYINFRIPDKQFFRFGWQFRFINGFAPLNESVIVPEDVYLGQAFRDFHITHFAESINMLLLHLRDFRSFPPITHLYLPYFQKESEIEWNRTYLSLIFDSFPEEYRPKLVHRLNVHRLAAKLPNKRLCFKSITLMDRMQYNRDGGIFGGFFSVDWIRSLSYKHAKIDLIPVVPQKLRVALVYRKGSREWVKPYNMKYAINMMFGHRITINETSMGGMTFAGQAQFLYNHEIVLSAHGSALANVFFMVPRTAMIECFPAFFWEMCFANIAFISRVHYIGIPTFIGYHLKTEMEQDALNLLNRGKLFLHRRSYANGAINTHINNILFGLSDAIDYVTTQHQKYSLNHKWSKLFN